MKLLEIVRYEVASQLRRYATALYAAGLIGMAWLVISTFFDDARRDGIFLNAPMVTAATLVLTSMIGLLVTAALAGEAATRDVQARIEPLLYTTPLSKVTYLGGRFLGAFAIGALLLAIIPLTLAAAKWMPGVDASFFGPFRAGSYLRAYVLVALPNVFIATSLLFSLVVLSRRAMVGYLGAAVLFLNAMVQDEIVAGLLGRWDLAKVLDPFGFMIARAQWRSWSILQRNTLPLELEGALLTNRLLWIGVSLAALTLAHLRFRMAHHAPASRWPWRRRAVDAPLDLTKPWTATLVTSRVRGTFTRATSVRQFLAIALGSFRELILSRAALMLPLVALLLFKIGPELMEVGLGTPGRPATGRLAMLYAKFSTVGIFIGAFIAFFAGQLVWRERDAREHDIADAAPVSDALVFAGKFAGLALVLVALQAFVMGAGIATQLSQDYTNHEPGLFLRVLFGLELVDYLCFAALAMAVHVVVNQKYLATTIAMLAWLYSAYANDLGIHHNLLIYGSDPGLRYSDLTGFGTLVPWLWFKLYWAGWTLVAALLARLFWVRGHDARRIAAARSRFTRIPAAIAAASLLLIALAGGVVFYNTNVLNEYRTGVDGANESAEYERKYSKYATLPQPILAATKLHIELHPDQGRADIRGTYRLENRSGRAIDTIHVLTHRHVPATGLALDRPARATLVDEKLGYRIYTLATPLAAGESIGLDFAVRYAPRGFTNHGVSAIVMENGTFIERRNDAPSGGDWLPAVGYRRGLELDNAGERRAHALPARPRIRPVHDAATRMEETANEHIHLETIIGTAADETAIAPGSLRRSWTENGRRYFHYATDTTIANGYPILSSRYAVHRAKWKDVDVEVLYNPKHGWNVDRITRAAIASLDYHSRHFGPYPHRQLRLVEYPGGGLRLTGHPGTITWSEAFAFTNPEADPRKIDFPFAVVAHEVAHQWWGNQLVPANVEGAALLSESLAWYSALMVVEETFGREHVDGIMSVMRESYLSPHAAPEVPLLRSADKLAAYRTGAFAMHSLREAIGAERVNDALRRLIGDFRSARPPFPTSLDLYARLRAVTPVETRPLLKDLFEEITFWDLRTKAVRSRAVANGAYSVTLDLETYKVKLGPDARETRAPMNDAIEIGVFDDKGAPLYVQPHRIHSGLQTITVTVPRRPASAGIDPKNKLLDRKRDDNVRLISL